MTEANIDKITNSVFSIVMIALLIYYMLSLRKSPIALENKKSATPSQKTAWEKFSIVSAFIAAIGVLLYGVTKFCEMLK